MYVCGYACTRERAHKNARTHRAVGVMVLIATTASLPIRFALSRAAGAVFGVGGVVTPARFFNPPRAPARPPAPNADSLSLTHMHAHNHTHIHAHRFMAVSSLSAVTSPLLTGVWDMIDVGSFPALALGTLSVCMCVCVCVCVCMCECVCLCLHVCAWGAR